MRTLMLTALALALSACGSPGLFYGDPYAEGEFIRRNSENQTRAMNEMFRYNQQAEQNSLLGRPTYPRY